MPNGRSRHGSPGSEPCSAATTPRRSTWYSTRPRCTASPRPEVTVQVLPFTAGGHAGMDGDFVLLTFPDPQDPPVAYVEGLMGDVYVEADADLDLFSLAWAQLVTSALDPGESTAMISQ